MTKYIIVICILAVAFLISTMALILLSINGIIKTDGDVKRIYKIKYEKSDTSDVGRYVSSLPAIYMIYTSSMKKALKMFFKEKGNNVTVLDVSIFLGIEHKIEEEENND